MGSEFLRRGINSEASDCCVSVEKRDGASASCAWDTQDLAHAGAGFKALSCAAYILLPVPATAYGSSSGRLTSSEGVNWGAEPVPVANLHLDPALEPYEHHVAGVCRAYE